MIFENNGTVEKIGPTSKTMILIMIILMIIIMIIMILIMILQ